LFNSFFQAKIIVLKPSSSRCIHPFQNRALSTREGARLQGFPDNYAFYGSKTSKMSVKEVKYFINFKLLACQNYSVVASQKTKIES
jgi:hypothetical protein